MIIIRTLHNFNRCSSASQFIAIAVQKNNNLWQLLANCWQLLFKKNNNLWQLLANCWQLLFKKK